MSKCSVSVREAVYNPFCLPPTSVLILTVQIPRFDLDRSPLDLAISSQISTLDQSYEIFPISKVRVSPFTFMRLECIPKTLIQTSNQN